MANEFRIKNGYLAEGNSQITGSLIVTGGITGSLQGIATTASFVTASSVVGTVTSASYALSASDASGIASAITNNGNNYLLTATGGGTIDGEYTLTFDGNKLTAQSSFALGGGRANGLYSHAEGESSEANGNFSHAEGYVTFAGSSQGYRADSITNGTCSLDAYYGDLSAEYTAGDLVLFDDTEYDAAYGTQTFTVASSSYSGSITQVYFTSFITTTEAVIGNLTTGVPLWAGGYRIGGVYSHAEGQSTYALGQYSHAEGSGTQAIGYGSHAEGVDTQAIGVDSHAEGINTTTIGRRSHAEGAFTTTSGEASHAEGYHTIASGSYQHVSGQFNTHGDDTSLFIVGNGTSGSRSDAFKVRQSGSIVLPTTVSGTPSWTGTQGEMVFYDNGGGTYRMIVWLGGDWRSTQLT